MSEILVALRSLAFNVLFHLNFFLFGVLLLPRMLLSDRVMMDGVKGWGASTIWLLRHVAGVKTEFRGSIPPGPILVVSKHQSALETFALIPPFEFPSFVLKKELMSVPFFGWYAKKSGMIPVDRKGKASALHDMVQHAEAALQQGRQIVIFPEGTRRAPGAPPDYKLGVAFLYSELGVPVLPVALNTGLFWPRNGFLKHPGNPVIEFLEPIAPGMKRSAFLSLVEQRIETATAALIAEALEERAARTPLSFAERAGRSDA